jgi:hypothetical protein
MRHDSPDTVPEKRARNTSGPWIDPLSTGRVATSRCLPARDKSLSWEASPSPRLPGFIPHPFHSVVPSTGPNTGEASMPCQPRREEMAISDKPPSPESLPTASRIATRSSALTPVVKVPMAISHWDMATFSAPKSILAWMREEAESAWLAETGHAWMSRSRNCCSRRMVIPLSISVSQATEIAHWLRIVSDTNAFSTRLHSVLTRPTDEVINDLMSSGVGFCPPDCGSLGLHRDSKDGVTLLVALDPIYPAGGSIVFLPRSEHHTVSKGAVSRSFLCVANWPFEEYSLSSKVPGHCWLFPSATLHWGRSNALVNNWRIIYNVVLGSTEGNIVSEIHQ